MSALKFAVNYSALAPKEPSVIVLKKFFNRANANVITIDVDPSIKTSSGIKYKELQFGFTDSQQVVFQVKATGDIFMVKLNGKDVPIKNQDNEAKAVIDIINAMDDGRVKFQAKLAKTVVKLPVMKTSVVSIEQQLTEQRDELKNQIAQVRADIVTAQSEQAAKAKDDVVVALTGKELGDFPDTEEGNKALRSAVKDHLMAMRGEWVDCPALSAKVEIRKRGVEKVISSSADERKLKIMTKIKPLIQSAKKIKDRHPYNQSDDKSAVAYYVLKSKAILNNESFSIRIIVKEDVNGKFHYDATVRDIDAVFDGVKEKGRDESAPFLPLLPMAGEQNPSRFASGQLDSSLDVNFDSVNGRMVLNLFIEGEEPEYVEDDPEDGQSLVTQEETQNPDRFADTGYIAGSRKEMASGFIRNAGKEGLHLGVTDIDWLSIEENPREAAEVITKANVIGKPDYEALVSGGMKPATAFLISKVYASIATKPGAGSPMARKAYVRGIETLRKNLEKMKEPSEVADYLSHVVYEEMTQPQFTVEESEQMKQLEQEFYDTRNYDIKKQVRAIYSLAMERTKKEGDIYQAWNGLGSRFVGVAKHRFNTGSKAFQKNLYDSKRGKPNNLDWLEKKPINQKDSGGRDTEPKKKKFELFVSDSFDRVGGRQINVNSTKALKEQFGLRDVQSGNWVLKDKASAEFHVIRSAEAFVDLADVLGIEDHKVSMGGRLAMAFGARGTAGARAHYEPVQRVINLTKMNGGGSLAHEWFHAFDNLLIEKMGVGTSAAGDFLTEKPSLAGDSVVASAFNQLVNAMTHGDAVVKKRVTYSKSDVLQLKANMTNSYMKKLIEAGSFDEAYKIINDQGARFGRGAKGVFESLAAAYYNGSKEEGGFAVANHKTGNSYFYENAAILDGGKGKKYWSTNLEMAARAFSGYIEDKMGDMGRKNDYLSNHATNDAMAYGDTEAKPFPEGEERKRINEAFDQLFSVIKQEAVLDSLINLLNLDEVVK